MRIARQPGSNNKKNMRGFALFFVLLLITPLTILRAEEPAGPSEVSTADIEVTSQAVVINLAVSEPAGVRSFNLTSPGRIVFDIENAVLSLDNEAVTLWESPMDGIVDLTIAQFSLDPPVVRIVAEISDPVLQSDRMSTLDTISLAVFAGESPFGEDIGPGVPPEQLKPIIERFWHEATEAGEDRFVIEFSFGVILPQVRIESSTVLLLRFPGADVLLPASSPDNFATSVSGILVRQMRAERQIENGEMLTEIRLTVPNTNVLSYTLSTFSDDSLELIMFAEEIPVPEELEIIEREPMPVPIEGGEIMVLASSDDIPVMPDAPIRITRVQFQTLDSETDRYYVYFEGGNLEPHIQRFNYPTRVALYFPDAAVVLPESAAGRFQVAVHGAVTDELKVFNRVIEDAGPESQFIFYFPGYDQENIGFSVDYVETGLMHIDFYRTAVPIDIETPVEVNLSIDQPAPAPGVIEEPEMVEGPVVLEPTETESTLPPEFLQSDTPLIIVASGEVVDGVVKFRINTTEQLSLPQWVEYHYPDRLGLRFPYADVQLLEAAPGICSSYTHIRAVPLVRAIMKDRDDEQHTTITFTLERSIEDYFRNVEETGSGYMVTFSYSPIPAGHEIIEEPVTPEIVEPVLVEEPVEAVEPEPVIAEPELIEPVLVSEPELPVITVASGEEVDGVIKFRINTT
ncbi:AMIN domain-containing protein, partial [bacterium]|nr:AMIN domain-containing protein [bacterium]